MTDRRIPVKVAALLAPLILSILALHAWGDAMAGGLSRAAGAWYYPERDHGLFRIRVPRRSDDPDVFAARALQDFVAEAVRVHGRDLGIRAPSQTLRVVLLDLDTDARRYRWAAAESLMNGNDGLFDPATRTIYVRMERKIQQEAVVAALRQAAARALLFDAGSSRWSPWLTEGLVGRLEGTKPAALRNLTGSELPSVDLLLTARLADFQGIHASAYSRGAKLLVTYLMEVHAEEFDYYYCALRDGLPPSDSLFSNLKMLDSDWKKWIQDQK